MQALTDQAGATTTFTNAGKNLKTLIHQVCKDSEPAVIVSNRIDEQAVLISLEDYQAMKKRASLLSSPTNRAHLEKSLKESQSGKLVSFAAEDLGKSNSRGKPGRILSGFWTTTSTCQAHPRVT